MNFYDRWQALREFSHASGKYHRILTLNTQTKPLSKALMQTLQLGRYRHFKGNEYEVIGTAKDSETLASFVVYRALYGDTQQLWIRPLTMFLEEIERDGKSMPRFTFIA
jgi:hypothetical protein